MVSLPCRAYDLVVSAPSSPAGRPALRIRGVSYPVFLPSWRDPRLHLASVIFSLHVLGQVAFNFLLPSSSFPATDGPIGDEAPNPPPPPPLPPHPLLLLQS